MQGRGRLLRRHTLQRRRGVATAASGPEPAVDKSSLAECFYDTRAQRFVDHSVQQLLAQRIYAIALGYEDLNDHERLRLDPLARCSLQQNQSLGRDRFNPEHRGIALAGASDGSSSGASLFDRGVWCA